MNQEIKESISETKLYGFPKPFAGAVIGVTLFTIILLLFWMKGSQDSAPVIALLLPGIGAIDLLGLPSDKLPISNFTQKVLV